MLVRNVIVTVFLSYMVTGQTQDFDQECHILKMLDELEDRLQKQEAMNEQQATGLQHQEALLGNQTDQLKYQEALLGNQTDQLKYQEALLGNQTDQLKYQAALLENQTALLQQQQTLLEQQTVRIREQEAEISALKQPKTDCGVLYANGITQSGVYVISPGGGLPFDVFCDMADDGWTVIQRRIDGAVNFNRTWDEYVQGFGDVNGDYWLGLEKIHRLSKDGVEIYFDIGNYDETREYSHFKNFTVHEATTLYKMNVDAFGYNGSIHDLFRNLNDTQFTTFDRDNDSLAGGNCAQFVGGGGGWWYRGCGAFFFNGVFGKKRSDGMRYYNRTDVYVKTVTIKVKQRLQ